MTPISIIFTLVTLALKHQDEIAKIISIAAPVIKGFSEAATQQSQPQSLDVRWLQISLNKLVEAGLNVDGDYGPTTRAAVKKFQSLFMPGEAVDGWAGVKTTAAILAALKEGVDE